MPKLTQKNGILAWHFTDGMKLRDGTPLIVGVTYNHKGKLALCKSGYHASVKALDALGFAPGNQIARVLCWGDVLHGDDKLVCTRRTVIKTINASKTLHAFARWCALQVVDKWDCPVIVRQYLETGDESIWAAAQAAAQAAARAAARDAAWDAARAAAWDAAWDAARAAAQAAARAAAWDAARDVTRDSARAAAQQKQNEKLEELLAEALK